MPARRDSRMVKYGLIIFFILILIYAYFESRAMLYGPRISVPTGTIIVDEPYTIIRGQAENIAELRINGTIVPVTEDGRFEEEYLVAHGQNYVVLDARDKYGRTQQETIEVVYLGEEPAAPAFPAATSTPATTTPPQTGPTS
jgi:hypothetical protein